VKFKIAKKHGPKGQTLILGLIFITVFISFLSYTIYMGESTHKKMKLQNIADAAAFSGAVAQARILNCIAAYNQAISIINNIVTKIVLIWLFLKGCAVFCIFGFGCICAKALKIFEKIAKPILKLLEKLANAMAELQDKLLSHGNKFVLAEIIKIVDINGASLSLYEINRLRDSLKFHLERANESSELSESGMTDETKRVVNNDRDKLMSCYQKRWYPSDYNKAKSFWINEARTKNIEWFYKDKKGIEKTHDKPKGLSYKQGKNTFHFEHAEVTECKKVSSILTGDYKLPNPLILKNDFVEKQKIAVLVSMKAFINTQVFTKNAKAETKFLGIAQAKPKGSNIFKMEWRATIEKVIMTKKLMISLGLSGNKNIKNLLIPYENLLAH